MIIYNSHTIFLFAVLGVLTPPDHEQTVKTIRLASWHNKLKDLIAS